MAETRPISTSATSNSISEKPACRRGRLAVIGAPQTEGHDPVVEAAAALHGYFDAMSRSAAGFGGGVVSSL